MTLKRNDSTIRQYRPAVGTKIKLSEFSQYGIVAKQHPEDSLSVWSWFVVRATKEFSVDAEHYNAGNTGIVYALPLEWIDPPIGWEPRYTIYCKPEQAQTIVRDWFARGIVVRQSHDMSGSMPKAFQPMTDGILPGSPHWQYPEYPDVIMPEDCARLFRVVSVEKEEITSVTLGYPADPTCTSCSGTGRRTIAQLAEVRKETVETTWALIDNGTIQNLEDVQTVSNVHSAFDTFRCHCHYGALGRMGRTKRAKLFKEMRAAGWDVHYVPYAGGFWERTRETIVHDWTELKLITCPQCGNEIPYEWNARGMTRCVQCHLLFENPEAL